MRGEALICENFGCEPSLKKFKISSEEEFQENLDEKNSTKKFSEI